uniref:CRAL-TRIO domain-containing protein n=3 Tax=Sar TaxID=2698737 RepID=A0A7S2SFL2_9STRA|mmetsp:Transcript_36435/g.58574  ORF Transcript_36435/g.58574 Transcript_36435/m.58574 type:complete len:460 (+) Transcript_36435:2969-4348(+)
MGDGDVQVAAGDKHAVAKKAKMNPEDWGTLGHLTDKEEAALEELRKRVLEAGLDQYNEDKMLLRYCRARKFKVDKSMHMITEEAKWREQFQGHTFRISDFPSMLQFSDDGVCKTGGRDKAGRPVAYVVPGLFYPSRVGSDQELVLYDVYYMDALLRLAAENGREDFTGIIDMKGWSFKNFSLPITRLLISILQDFYPERLGRIFVVNAPMMFSAVWNIVSPLLDERTKMKIHILKKDRAPILEVIDADQLEKAYGGNHETYPSRDEIVQPLYDQEQRPKVVSFEGQMDDDVEAKSTTSEEDILGVPETPSVREKKKRTLMKSTSRRFHLMIKKLKGESSMSSSDELSPRSSAQQATGTTVLNTNRSKRSSFKYKSSKDSVKILRAQLDETVGAIASLTAKVGDQQKNIEDLTATVEQLSDTLKHSKNQRELTPTNTMMFHFSIMILFALQIWGMISQYL